MKSGDKYFVRIDSKVENAISSKDDFDNHIAYLKEVAKTSTFYGGGFANKDGGMIIFKAINIEHAKKIADGDPLIKNKLYTYDLYEWNVLLTSQE